LIRNLEVKERNKKYYNKDKFILFQKLID